MSISVRVLQLSEPGGSGVWFRTWLKLWPLWAGSVSHAEVSRTSGTQRLSLRWEAVCCPLDWTGSYGWWDGQNSCREDGGTRERLSIESSDWDPLWATHCLSIFSSWFSPQKAFTSNSTAHFCPAHRNTQFAHLQLVSFIGQIGCFQRTAWQRREREADVKHQCVYSETLWCWSNVQMKNMKGWV